MQRIVLILISMCVVCSGHEWKPFTTEFRLLDRIAGFALRQPVRAEEAVLVLTALLNGQPDSQIQKFTELSGADPASAGQLGLTSPEVRCRAAYKLAEIDAQFAEDALHAFKLERAHWDRDFDVFGCVQESLIAYHIARAPSDQGKIRILEGALDFSVHMYGIDMPVRAWAREKLCDLGAADDLPRIQQGMLEVRNDASSEDEIGYCRARVAVVARDPDRAKALGTLLFPNGFNGPMPPGMTASMTGSERKANELRGWALWQLADMHTAEADGLLARYFAGIDRLDRQHPLHWEAVQQLESLHELWAAYGNKSKP